MKQIVLTCCLLAVTMLRAQIPFSPLDTNFRTQTIVVPPSPLKLNILCVAQDCTAYDVYSDSWGTVKEWADFTGYMPINGSSDSGYVVINNELLVNDNAFGGGQGFGDGGGMTQFKVKKTNGVWSTVAQEKVDNKPVFYKNINFTPVGLTAANCGGWKTPWGTILTAEEWSQTSNVNIRKGSTFQNTTGADGTGIRDTSDYTIPATGHGVFNGVTLKRYQNLNWIVEVDPVTATVVKKHYSMGRFEHEQAYVMDDQKTVYLTDDFTPAVFFKFVAKTAGDLSEGVLYAYKQNSNGVGGTWLPINDVTQTAAQQRDSLMDARNVALRAGATTGIRHEWLTYIQGKLYICETGRDNANLRNPSAVKNGVPELHLQQKFPNWSTADMPDYFGRVIEFDIATNTMRSYIEGGPATSGMALSKGYHLSNPDGVESVSIGNKNFLIIMEDLNGQSQGRNPSYVSGSNTTICEMYFLDLSITNPTVNDLQLFLIGPKGCEVTGCAFTPDATSAFVNMQHPNTTNTPPYNRSLTAVITGMQEYLLTSTEAPVWEGESLQFYPNPASRVLHLSKPSDIAIYDAKGQRKLVSRNVETIDISQLSAGVYFIQTTNQQVFKLVVE
ncbi:MAG: DUF839 domain-containing protein [Cytophagaceae bacterium]|jgi:hypothetical protein|nr:DUF839 domain-containing protein [Cytophagaceae bacterium]